MALLAMLAVPAGAQQQAPSTGGGLPTPSVRTARATGMRVDGRLDEAAWAAAETAGGFVQQRPRSGEPASQATEVRVLYDDDAIYVGARMLDTHADSIAAQLARRDATVYSDWFHVTIDSYQDRRTAFRFAVNPLGVQKDAYHSNDTGEDLGWDAVWDVATSRDAQGWTAEFRIPLSQLRFGGDGAGERRWGVNFARDIARLEERSYWSPIPANHNGYVSRVGELRGLVGLASSAKMEVLPYTSARLDRSPGAAGDPFHRANDWAGSAGADVKLGLPAGLTLTATINPDFGQVEVDPAVVNLSAFETFFPEKRPFFVEGSGIFSFGQINAFNSFGFISNLYYTRRLGRQPQRFLSGDFVDAPDQTTILGAAKVSGRTPGGWSVGLMDALTARESGELEIAGGGGPDVRRTEPVEPLTNYLVGRVRRDLNGGNTVVGALATAVNRDLRGDEFDAQLRSSAYVAGIDGEHAWSNRLWTLSGSLVGSRIAGSEAAVTRAQRSSARYFQRPDADHLSVDPDATEMRGWAGSLALSRSGGYDLSVALQEVSPGFESNDLGFQGSADRRGVSTFLGRRVPRALGPFRSHSYWVFTNHGWNHGGDNVYADFGAGANVTLHSLWGAGFEGGYSPRHVNDRLTRGGPLAEVPGRWRLSVNGNSDARKRISLQGGVFLAGDDGGASERSASMTMSVRPSSSVQLSFGPSFTRQLSTNQYVTTQLDETATATFGRRDVFADVRQTTVSMDTRLDWTFTPRLSLQLFAQPFVSAADFARYKEFRAAGTYDFDVYGVDRGTIVPEGDAFRVDPGGGAPSFLVGEDSQSRDFNLVSLRGNAVLRWEYRPGSTVFLVWQQDRFGERGYGDFDTGRDVGDVFTQPARNVFLLKFTYWLSR